MLGFAVVNCPDGSDVTAVWLTSRVTPARATHTNAVCVSNSDPERDRKIKALVADRVVVLTSGSRLPAALSSPLPNEAIGDLTAATVALQERIVEAIDARSSSLVQPVFASAATEPMSPTSPDPAQRALAAASYVVRAWNGWLETEEQRRRRTIDPRTGESPWIMPEDLNQADLAELPPAFAATAAPEPVA